LRANIISIKRLLASMLPLGSKPKKRIKVKICLVGEYAVGKTSLIQRFVVDTFQDRYIPTIGTKITKAFIPLKQGNENVQVDMTIWDIMGEKGFRELLKDAYFDGAQ